MPDLLAKSGARVKHASMLSPLAKSGEKAKHVSALFGLTERGEKVKCTRMKLSLGRQACARGQGGTAAGDGDQTKQIIRKCCKLDSSREIVLLSASCLSSL